MPLSVLTLLLLLFSVPTTKPASAPAPKLHSTLATRESAAILYSDSGGFMVSVPNGWVLDRATGERMGTCCVLYPQGTSWEQASSVIYPNIAERQPGQSLQQLMETDVSGFRKHYPGMNVAQAQDLPTGQNQFAKIRCFYGVNQD